MASLQADHLFALPVAIPIAVGFQLASLLKSPLLSPVVTGATLFALTRAPDQIRAPLLSSLQQRLSSTAIERGLLVLKVLFGLGLARRLQDYLNVLAQNNFRFRSEKHRYNWTSEIAVVTGAAGGIGRIMAIDLAAKGVKVIAVDVAPESPTVFHKNARIFYRQCDLTDRAAVMALAQRIQQEHGHPSILINNAGIAYKHTTLSTSEEAVRRIYEINVIAHYWTVQAFLPAMLENRKGHIVATASMASFIGTGGLGAYSGSKVAALAFHETLSQELRRIHQVPEILLTVAHPTFVRTPMTVSATKEIEGVTSLITPEEVSSAVMKNIFDARGGQVIIPGKLGYIPTLLRNLPHWMKYALIRSGELGQRNIDMGGEQKMG